MYDYEFIIKYIVFVLVIFIVVLPVLGAINYRITRWRIRKFGEWFEEGRSRNHEKKH